MANEIGADVEKLMLTYSQITPRHIPRGLITWETYKWNDLDSESRRLQHKILEKYGVYSSLIRTLLRSSSKQDIRLLDESDKNILRIANRNGYTSFNSTKDALYSLVESQKVQSGLLESLYQGTDSSVIYVPDTNALLFNPDLDLWRFPETPKFSLALTPTVLSELDSLKVTHRSEELRKKAEGIISRIKGYRTRGRLSDGVTLARDVSELFTLAMEPDFDNTLPWLESDNKDDRIIASFIEVMRSHPRSAVVLVTRDVNLQNKVEFARLLFCEPPAP